MACCSANANRAMFVMLMPDCRRIVQLSSLVVDCRPAEQLSVCSSNRWHHTTHPADSRVVPIAWVHTDQRVRRFNCRLPRTAHHHVGPARILTPPVPVLQVQHMPECPCLHIQDTSSNNGRHLPPGIRPHPASASARVTIVMSCHRRPGNVCHINSTRSTSNVLPPLFQYTFN